MNKRRLFIIANRLPINIKENGEEINVVPSAGGLVTAIDSYLSKSHAEANDFSETYWVGAPCCTPGTWTKAEKNIPSSKYTYVPVYLKKQVYENYYNGFSNSVVWPLFHYFPSFAEYSLETYQDYFKANAAFKEVLIKYIRPNDVIWIHDYHLLPLANMLRKAMPQLTIGFFLHIPFPSYEIIRLMPKKWQEELLQGMLGADLIGFQTMDYASHFLHSVQMVLGLENDMHLIRHEDRLVKADVFPISIDFDRFNKAYTNEKVVSIREVMKQKFAGKKIIFSVDRLDYTKGVRNRLKGYEHFLKQNPQYHEKVVFIMVIVPSREFVSKYAERKKLIDETISNLNSKVGNFHWQPIIYQYNSLNFEELVALFTVSDLAMITPLRDGMNLVAKEFVASRKDKKGVLMLSEMAGAARELTTALTINPNDIEEIAQKIVEGFEMPEVEQEERLEVMQKRIAHYDVTAWANDFLNQLAAVKKKQHDFQVKFMDFSERRNLLDKYRRASERLILLDYDGTLVPFSSEPMQAAPDANLLSLLKDLTSDQQNNVFIISGRDSTTLDNWFKHLPINIVAEHGARMKLKDKEWRNQIIVQQEWKTKVEEVMQIYVQRCAHSFIEIKEFSMVWHYRNCDKVQARLRSLELFGELSEYTYNLGVQVLMGNKIVEVRVKGFDKGTIVKKEILDEKYDFVFAVGDDRTDEDMFRILADFENTYTVKIGSEASFAKFNLHTPQMLLSVLDAMNHLPKEHYV